MAPGREGVHIAVVGTNDVHGRLLPADERGGLVELSGYVAALRASGETDAVLLVDAGDMWQGTLESNLDEGASMVAAYGALGYAAAAIGNHEFDFGPAGSAATPAGPGDDARGALRARAAEAAFPLLAANLADEAGRQPPRWDNVHASVMVEAAGVDVGIVGVLTEGALGATIAANVQGLKVTPLAAAVEREALGLRRAGAELVVVAAHAGGRCASHDDPLDLSSCETGSEIFALAERLPPGLVDHIVAGHVHHQLAHIVNGISITSNEAGTRSFGRTDFRVGADGRVERLRVHPPQPPCPYRNRTDQSCAWRDPGDGSVRTSIYAGQPVVPVPAVVAIAERARAAAASVKSEKLGVLLAGPFTLEGNPESALGNLVTGALLESFAADVAIHNVTGGLRAALPAGELTFGDVYEMFPFDNRVVILELSGAELREVLRVQAGKRRGRAGIAGVRAAVTCRHGEAEVAIVRDSGEPVPDGQHLRVVANDFLATGGDGILTPVLPPGGLQMDGALPLTRDVLLDWFRRWERLAPEDWSSADAPRWQLGPGCAEAAAD